MFSANAIAVVILVFIVLGGVALATHVPGAIHQAKLKRERLKQARLETQILEEKRTNEIMKSSELTPDQKLAEWHKQKSYAAV